MSSKKICSHPTSGYLCGCVCSVMSDSLGPHGLQHARLSCLSLSPWAYSNSCSSSPWCHPTISSSVTLFSSHLQSFPASGSFPVSHSFASGGRSTGASASAPVLPMNLHDGSPLGWTGLISLLSKGHPYKGDENSNYPDGWCEDYRMWCDRPHQHSYVKFCGLKIKIAMIGKLSEGKFGF